MISGNIPYLPFADYLAAEGVSKSALDLINRSPAHYRQSILQPEAPTPAMIWGSMFHSFVLEPEVFEATYAVMPEGIDRRTKEGKQAWQDWQESHEGLLPVDKPTLAEIIAMRDSLLSSPKACTAMSEGVAEASLFWLTGEIACKGRPDYIRPDLIIDLKTTIDARPDVFSRQVWNYRYHVQAAYYIDGMTSLDGQKPRDFLFIAIEKSPPYGIQFYLADQTMIDQGRREYQQDMEVYAQCMASDEWPCYSDEIQAILLPRWAQEVTSG
jgi:hypothetical protein